MAPRAADAGEAFYALHAANLPDVPLERRSKWDESSLIGGAGRPSGMRPVGLHPAYGKSLSAVHAYDSIVFLTRQARPQAQRASCPCIVHPIPFLFQGTTEGGSLSPGPLLFSRRHTPDGFGKLLINFPLRKRTAI